ncbi:CotH kinase family protein [Aeromicrobium sp.]|uniref:CotH kinase family protein n=1 Tax=Aeromicrobium sp. TaxID=1871063 RepID=UPI003C47B640
MRRIVSVSVALALLSFTLVSCGGGEDAPSVSNDAPFVGEKFTVSGSIGTDGARPVTLESFDEGWSKVAAATTTKDGGYTFTTSLDQPSRFRVVAAATGKLEKHVTQPVKVDTVDDSASLSVVRTGNKGTAIGEAKYRKKGRNFELQWLDGSTWKKLGSGKDDGHGRTKIDFDVKGSRFYRVVGEVVRGTKGAMSPATRFTKGPKRLGKKVVYVNTDGFKDPVVRGAPYEANAVLVTDGQISKPLRIDEFAVRGNTTATKLKKPYKMKFKKARRPFGLPEDKTWVLLANFQDRTLVRNQVAYNVGAGLDGLKWTPHGTFVELYLNGVYRGSYQISESIKIDKNRVNIDPKKGIIVEVDKHYKEGGVPGFMGDHQIPYAFKDPDERKKGKKRDEGITADKIAGMKSRILEFEKVLYGSNFKDPDEGWTKYLDIDSAVDFYLAKEFTKENDSDFYRSTFFYIPDYTSTSKKMVMGPIWDFDRSAGAKPDAVETQTTVASPQGWWLRGHGSQHHSTDKTHWYVHLIDDPVFIKALKKRWAEKRGFFKDIADHGVEREGAKVGVAAKNDRSMFGAIDSGRLAARAPTYAGEIAYLKDWYQKRFAWMDSKLR